MAEDPKRRKLGRGLSALFDQDQSEPETNETAPSRGGSTSVPIEFLHPGKFQPRHRMADGDIDDLAASIQEMGVLQPIIVRRDPSSIDSYEIIAGERRWRAAQKAQQHRVPVIIRDFSDGEALEVALVENLQREDLSPIEEAEGFRRLMEEFSHTQDDLAKVLGKSRSHVANTIRLLNLPDEVKAMVDEGALSAGHARALLNASDPAKYAQAVIKRGLNVRQTERLVQRSKNGSTRRRIPAEKDADTLALERDVSAILGLPVSITYTGSGGTVAVRYRTLEQLDDLLHRLSHGARGEPAAPADADAGGGTDGDDLDMLDGTADSAGMPAAEVSQNPVGLNDDESNDALEFYDGADTARPAAPGADGGGDQTLDGDDT